MYGLHGDIYKRMATFVTTAVRSSNPTSNEFMLSYLTRAEEKKKKKKKKEEEEEEEKEL
jgi:hypothetical protein